jgi:diguanylate cyclase (GGDEF)-like protein
MRRARRSTWFIFAVVIIEVVTLTALVWNSVRLISSSHAELLEATTREANRLLAHSLAPGLAAEDRARVQDALALLEGKQDLVYAVVINDRGQQVAALGRVPGDFRADSDFEAARRDGVYDTATPVRFYGQRLGTVRAGYSIAHVQALTRQARWQNTAIAGVEIGLSILVTLLLGLFFTRNLRRLEQGAEALAAGRLDHRISVRGNDEFADVARSFNHMADHLTRTSAELEAKNQALERQTRHFQTLLDSIEAVVVEADPDTWQFAYVSQEAVNLLGFPADHWFRPGFWLERLHPADEEDFRHTMAVHSQAPNSFTHDYRMIHRDGHAVWVRGIHAVDQGEGGQLVLRGLLLDVTEEKLSEERIVYLADHDPLTGLFNRRRFQEELERHLGYARGYRHQGALLVFGLDQFKYINDTLGHRTGDHYLHSVASAITASLSEVDVAGRLGGDEFGIIRPRAEAGSVEALVAELQERLTDPELTGGVAPTPVTASAGVVYFPSEGDHADDLLAKADVALHSAKESGRNRLHVFSGSDETLGRMRAKIHWEDRIRRALEEDRFQLYYQPIFRLDDGSISHYEVLLRMVGDDGELVGPGAFLDTAERFGMIRDIDHWVVTRALRVQGRSRQQGRPVRLAINLSGRHIGRREVLEWVTGAIEESGADPEALLFEITETAAVENIAQAREFIDALRTRGCGVALDDFGVGLSSFHYLKNLPVDMIKIDGSFVRTLDRDAYDRTFVRAMSELAATLGIQSVAEFVENEAIVEVLRELGVDLGQGFHLARPGPEFGGSDGPVPWG